MRLKYIRIGLAVIFGALALVKLFHGDFHDGLWSFAVCLALVLGLLPAWLTGAGVAAKTIKAEKYDSLH